MPTPLDKLKSKARERVQDIFLDSSIPRKVQKELISHITQGINASETPCGIIRALLSFMSREEFHRAIETQNDS